MFYIDVEREAERQDRLVAAIGTVSAIAEALTDTRKHGSPIDRFSRLLEGGGRGQAGARDGAHMAELRERIMSQFPEIANPEQRHRGYETARRAEG